MIFKRFLLAIGFSLITFSVVNAQYRKIDTTMKVGKAGYKIYCNNKNPDKNNLNVTPVGFEKDARMISLEIKGRILGVEVDDLNNDGFPDVLLYVYSSDPNNYGKVFGIYSEQNTGIRPIIFPDILDDPKLKIGYKGHDEYILMEGSLMRRFPIYQNTDSAKMEPTGMIRQIQYRVVPNEPQGFKFKAIRSFDFKKQ
jgi:CRISPR/Cas system-associated protein endoribonuclease Cas2